MEEKPTVFEATRSKGNSLVELANIVLDRPAQALAVTGVIGLVLIALIPTLRGQAAPENVAGALIAIASGAAGYYFKGKQ